MKVLERLQPNNYEVVAYYLYNAAGTIDKVYLYQNELYLCEASKIETYNTATAEQTQTDRDAYAAQASYVSQFDKFIKAGRKELPKLGIIEKTTEAEIETIALKVEVVETEDDDTDTFDYAFTTQLTAKRALDNL